MGRRRGRTSVQVAAYLTLARILEKQNRLQMSQVFSVACIDDQMGVAFQGFYERDQGTGKVTGFPHQL